MQLLNRLVLNFRLWQYRQLCGASPEFAIESQKISELFWSREEDFRAKNLVELEAQANARIDLLMGDFCDD